MWLVLIASPVKQFKYTHTLLHGRGLYKVLVQRSTLIRA